MVPVDPSEKEGGDHTGRRAPRGHSREARDTKNEN
jgi:hypothetical protein